MEINNRSEDAIQFDDLTVLAKTDIQPGKSDTQDFEIEDAQANNTLSWVDSINTDSDHKHYYIMS